MHPTRFGHSVDRLQVVNDTVSTHHCQKADLLVYVLLQLQG